MNELLNLNFNQSIPFFPPDSWAWGHAALGFGTGFLDPQAQAIVALLFLLYEMYRDKPAFEKLGAIAEFGTGFLAQRAIGGTKA